MNGNSNYDKDYLPYIIKWGRLTNYTAVLFSFAPALVLLTVFKVIPPYTAILNGFIAIASAVAVVWFVEPISYFPIIGISGTYMAFISGYVGNLRIPCAMVAQKIAGVEPGTKEGTIVATLGMAVSIVINTTILTLGIVAGAQVLQKLPANIVSMLQLLLPALFGAVFMQFALKKLKLAPIVLLISIALVYGAKIKLYPSFVSTLGAVFISIAIGVFLYKKGVIK